MPNPKSRLSRRTLQAFAIVSAGAGITYYFWGRPWQNRWGAWEIEVAQPMPGDDLIKKPLAHSTMAVTIQAAPHAIWPWLVQLGQGRGGWYSYAGLERRLGLNITNANQILSQYQNLKPGDVIPTGAKGLDIPVLQVEKDRYLLLGGPEMATIAFGLYPLDERSTRLVLRTRFKSPTSPASLLGQLLLEPAMFLMNRKMLLGIKERAERYYPASPEDTRPINLELAEEKVYEALADEFLHPHRPTA